MESPTAKAGAAGRMRQSHVLTRKSLITDDPWDCYHLESLLPLKETYRETTKFGFLLRHYWIPATILTFRQSSRTTFSDGRVERRELEIERKMARCRSNECLWREKVRSLGAANEDNERPVLSELLCSYDCCEQTYVAARPILFAPPTSERRIEGRRHALYCLPILCPPGPVPLGFSWHAKAGNDYMNYRLEAEERIGETSVLVVRREGRYTLWLPSEGASPGNGPDRGRVVLERTGITLFAWNRATVLEDRFQDRTVEEERSSAFAGATGQVVTRLIRSCPERLAEPVRRKPQNDEAADQANCECQG